jgi:hypothetical protein
MSVALLYIEGCPSWRVAADNLRAALRAVGRTDRVDCRVVETAEEADAIGFAGSPTVLIDGHDPFAAPTAGVGLACRVYRTPEGPAGAPTVAQLVTILHNKVP